MTKRDSGCAGNDSPRVPMQRRQFSLQFQNRSGAASSEDASSSATGHWPQPLNPPHGNDQSGTPSGAHHFGYASETLPVPLPSGSPSHHQGEAYPLQSEIQQRHRVLHSHIFKEALGNQQAGHPNRLMVTEVDRWGVERNRQPEFFFNGIVGNVRSEDAGYIIAGIKPPDLPITGAASTIFLKNRKTPWNSSWQNHQQPSDNADRTSEAHEVPFESDMEDNASITANLGTLPIRSQIHQLATVLFNILTSDLE